MFPRVVSSLARGALSIVICLPDTFSVDQAKPYQGRRKMRVR